MDPQTASDPTQFIHLRMLLSMVVSLALARLLSGLAKFVQHPEKTSVFLPHLLWSAFMLILLIHFWWWEFALIHLHTWTFGTFAFVIGYAAALYLMCAILYPDEVTEYGGYRGYFVSRRGWFLSVLAVVILVDVADTRLKGEAHWQAYTPAIWIHTTVGLAICGCAAWVKRPASQVAVAVCAVLLQMAWIARLYSVLR